MPLCPTCGTELDPAMRFCPKDGTTIRPDSVLVRVTDLAGEITSKPTVPMKTRARPTSTATDDPAVDKLIGRTLDGRYHVRRRLGQGGVGAVYEGEHVEIKRTLALKVLHGIFAESEEFRRRFEREAQAASRLQHPGCVQVIDFGRVARIEPAGADELAGMPYLVMEYVRGTLLLDRLIDGPPIGLDEAVEIVGDVLSALKHAHGLGIVHRDLKPGNVMLTPDGVTRTKLLDFGLAKQLGPDGGKDPLTQAGMVFGTPGYLSPEQAAGRPIDHRADLYSLGVILFEICCNRRLFEREDPLDAVRDHMHTPPPAPRGINPQISPALEAVILKSLEKDPARRYQTAEEFQAALKDAGAQAAAEARRPPSGARILELVGKLPLPKVGPPWLWPAVLGGALLVAAIAGVIAVASGSHAAEVPRGAQQPRQEPSPRVTGAPPSVSRRLELAAAYQKKRWCTDALEELEKAVRDEPAVRADPDLARPAIGCLTPKTQARALRFLTETVGAEAIPALEVAASSDPNPEIRRAAARALEKLR